MTGMERTVRTESVRIPKLRDTNGNCSALGASIRDYGLFRPIAVWKDGTVISGGRRLYAHTLMGLPAIRVVYVDTIEDAAKRLLGDNEDNTLTVAPKWSEVARLWELLRRLDEPVAARRAHEAQRRGVELRKQTVSGAREAGRSHSRTVDYVLSVICEPFGISVATARRIEVIYQSAYGTLDMAKNVTDAKRELAREVMADLDATGNVWANYQRLTGERQTVTRPRPIATTDSAPVARQLAAWSKSLPQMEGLTAGLIELGPPNPDLDWNQVGPVHARLTVIRRDLEKIIKQMKESNPS